MQQTEKYKLNKPGVDDPIAIAPLSENMDKVEAALDAVDSRVTTLELHKIAVGRYTGTGAKAPQTFELGFTPMVVIVCYANCYTLGTTMAVRDYPAYDDREEWPAVSIIPGGFQIGNSISNNSHYNLTGYKFNYVAFV